MFHVPSKIPPLKIILQTFYTAKISIEIKVTGMDYSMLNPIQKQLIAVKKSARPSKAELTATKSNDIIMQPCARCASCKINIS